MSSKTAAKSLSDENLRKSIVDDVPPEKFPKIGQWYKSFADTIEIISVGDPMTYLGKTDCRVTFKVVDVHSEEDSSLDFHSVDILWGDMISEDSEGNPGYILIDKYPLPVSTHEIVMINRDDLLAKIQEMKDAIERESITEARWGAYEALEKLAQSL